MSESDLAPTSNPVKRTDAARLFEFQYLQCSLGAFVLCIGDTLDPVLFMNYMQQPDSVRIFAAQDKEMIFYLPTCQANVASPQRALNRRLVPPCVMHL